MEAAAPMPSSSVGLSLSEKVGVYHSDGRSFFCYNKERIGRAYDPIEIHPLVGAALSLFDGLHTRGDVVDRLTQDLPSTPRKDIEEIVSDIFTCYRKFIMNHNTVAPRGDYSEFLNMLDGYRPHRSIDVVFKNGRFHFPLRLRWVVTNYCTRRCIYCYQNARRSDDPIDSTISTERIKALFQEASDLGATEIHLTGGEPFIRKDIYDILTFIIELGLRPVVFTKLSFSPSDVARLASMGLKEIFVSLDSFNSRVADKLTGTKGSCEELISSLRLFVQHGIEVVLSPVITSYNYEDLDLYVSSARDLGISRINFTIYRDNTQRVAALPSLSKSQIEGIETTVDGLNASAQGAMRLFVDSRNLRNFIGNEDIVICPGGVTLLIILPNGAAVRCDKAVRGVDFFIGDLQRHSVSEVWKAPKWDEFIVLDPEKFRGTTCYDCEKFQVCNLRNRCFFEAFNLHQKVYSPGPECLLGAI